MDGFSITGLTVSPDLSIIGELFLREREKDPFIVFDVKSKLKWHRRDLFSGSRHDNECSFLKISEKYSVTQILFEK